MASSESLPGVGPSLAKVLERLDCHNVLSILWHLPYALQRRHYIKNLSQAIPGELITFQAEVLQHFPSAEQFKSGARRPYRIAVGDATRFLDLIFFNARPQYLEQNLPVGSQRLISGRFENFQGKLQITHPDHIGALESLKDWQGIEPVYALTQGLSQKQMRKIVTTALHRVQPLPEWISSNILQKYQWQPWHDSLNRCHKPTQEIDTFPSSIHRRRLAFDELLANQLAIIIVRQAHSAQNGQVIRGSGLLQHKVRSILPFQLTKDQEQSLEEIKSDMESGQRMIRLLQGDVGAGKTIVAFLSLLKAVEAGFQGALLAPTEILVKQHFQTLSPWADVAGISLEILLGKDTPKVKKEKYERLSTGQIQIVVGTHALVQEGVIFQNLGLIVVDEQHRFGVEQRLKLAEKGQHVDVLAMTATPIPRTLMLAVYGDLSTSYLREKPSGREEIQTKAMSLDRLDDVLDGIQRVLREGDKIYWICPLIEESEKLDLAAAEKRFELLNLRFPGLTGLVHGRIKGPERDAIMTQFREGHLKILVATTVVEVGVHVEDATIMVIEHAERFGLSQLHQLRGRIGRGHQASTCILLYQNSLSDTAKARLKIMKSTNDGFKIAEEDLRLRGGGDALGLKQSGMPAFRLADLGYHQDLLALAQQESLDLLKRDPQLMSLQGQAARLLLALFGRESATRFLKAG